MKWYGRWLTYRLTYICQTQHLSSGKACLGSSETNRLPFATAELPNTAATSFSPSSNYSFMSTLDQSKCDWHRKEPQLSQCPLVQSSLPGIKSSILLAYKPGKTQQARAGFISRPVVWLTMQLHKLWHKLKVWELQCSFNSSLHLSQPKAMT